MSRVVRPSGPFLSLPSCITARSQWPSIPQTHIAYLGVTLVHATATETVLIATETLVITWSKLSANICHDRINTSFKIGGRHDVVWRDCIYDVISCDMDWNDMISRHGWHKFGNVQNAFFKWSPPRQIIFWHIVFLTFLLWHSIWRLIWHYISHVFWHSVWHSISQKFRHSI